MSKHLTGQDIDDIVSGMAGERDVEKAREHAGSCEKCRSELEIFSYIVDKQESGPAPDLCVKEAVVAEWYRIHNEVVEEKFSEKPRRKWIIPGFALTAAVVMVVFFVVLNRIYVEESFPLTVLAATEGVLIDNAPAFDNMAIISGSFLKTGDSATATLSSDEYLLYIGESSSLEVTGNSRSSGLNFRLIGGLVISRSSGELIYRFDCGNYMVIPTGTEFMLRLSGDKLTVAVSEGKVLVSGLELKLTIPAGRMWSSEHPGIVEPVDDEIRALMNEARPGIWHGYKSLNNIKGKPEVQASSGRESEQNDNKKTDNLKENVRSYDETGRVERIKTDREIRNEMNEIKEEQRMERRGRSNR